MKTKTINGRGILSIRTIKSWYDHDTVSAFDGKDNEFRMPTATILAMAKKFVFVPDQKRKYTYLTNPKLKGA